METSRVRPGNSQFGPRLDAVYAICRVVDLNIRQVETVTVRTHLNSSPSSIHLPP